MDTDSDGGWTDWSRATSSISEYQRPSPPPPAPPSPGISDSTASIVRGQPNLWIEIPPLRPSMAREYEDRPPSNPISPRDDYEDIQALLDQQIASEGSQFGILTYPARTPSPGLPGDDECVIISDAFLEELIAVAKESTPAETQPQPPSFTTSKIADNLPGLRLGPKPQTSQYSAKTPKLSISSTTRHLGINNSKRACVTKSKTSPTPALEPAVKHRRDRRRSCRRTLQNGNAFSIMQRTKATRTSTMLLSFDNEDLTATRTTITKGREDTTIEIEDEDEDDLIIIGTGRRRHQTVMSIRSRSLSQTAAAGGNTNANTNTMGKDKESLVRLPPTGVAKSRIPASNKKRPIP